MTRIEAIKQRVAAATSGMTPEDEYARSLQDRQDLRDLLELYDALKTHNTSGKRSRATFDKLTEVLSTLDSPVGEEGE